MKLLVGLGNPGSKYVDNRHNIGFLVLDNFVDVNNLIFKKNKFYHFCKKNDALMIKPQTYMNISGKAVLSALTSYPIDDILVIVDDIHLPFGKIRLRSNGGYGGHNGLRSIGEMLGSKDFKRMRIGIGTPEESDLSQYVLANFSQQEKKILNIVFNFAGELLESYIKQDFEASQNLYGQKFESYSEKISKSQDQ